MRNPGRWRRISLAAGLIGVAACLSAPLLPAGMAGEGSRALFFAIGTALAVPGLALAWHAHRAERARARMADGTAALARWRIDAAGWDAFLASEQTAGPMGPNELPARLRPGPDGIEIVIGEDAIAIGDSVHLLPRHGAPEVLDARLREAAPGLFVAELRLHHPSAPRANGSLAPAFVTRLGFPVAAAALDDARRAIAHYAHGRPGQATLVHGRGDGSDPDDLDTCQRCGYVTQRYLGACPECGGPMLSRRWARRYGKGLVVLGGALLAGMTWLLVVVAPLLSAPGAHGNGQAFGGSRSQALAVWTLLGAAWLFGAVLLAQGFHQWTTGRRRTGPASLAIGTLGLLALGAFAVLLGTG